MADDFSIQRKDLLPQLKRIDKKEWMDAAEKLGCVLTQKSGGTSHYAIRKPGSPTAGTEGLVSVVYNRMNKIPLVNQKTFKRFLKHGFSEDDVWKALKVLK